MDYIGLELQFNDLQWEEILVAELSEIGFYSFSGGRNLLRAYIPENEFDVQKPEECIFFNQNQEKIKFDKTNQKLC